MKVAGKRFVAEARKAVAVKLSPAEVTLAGTDLDSHKAEGTGWWRASDDPRATHPEAMTSPWAEGPWCWVLAEPRAFAKPVPWKGQQNLFEVAEGRVAGLEGVGIEPSDGFGGRGLWVLTRTH